MACRTTRQLLDHMKIFHRQLGDFYKETASQADQAKAKALLKYMGRNEEHLEECLAAYEKGAAQAVLDTWFAFMPEIAKCECFERIEVTPDMSIDDVVRIALWFDDCLRQFFREMATLSVTSDVKELFTALASMEEQEERKATRAALELTEGA